MDLNIKLTPYIEIEGDFLTNVTKSKRQCLTHQSLTFSTTDGFCNICGNMLSDVEYVENKKNPPYLILSHESDLYSPEYLDNILIPNIYSPEEIKIDDGETHAYDLTNIEGKKDTQIKWIKTKFSKEIELLKTSFGETNVKIKWGLITYWS